MINIVLNSKNYQFLETATIASLFKQLALTMKLEPGQIKVFANGAIIPYSRRRIGSLIPNNSEIKIIPLICTTNKSVKRAQKSLKKAHQVFFISSSTLANFVNSSTDVSGLLRNIEQHIGYYNINYIVAEQFMQIYELFMERENYE